MTASSSKERTINSLQQDDTNVPNFLKKTYEILENKIYSHIIAWHNEGRAIIIKDAAELADKILPLFFKHRNFTSYVRQLNLYGFKKLKSSSQHQIYCHPMFQRGRKDLLCRIKRKNAENIPITKSGSSDSIAGELEQRLSEQEDRHELSESDHPHVNDRENDAQLLVENSMLKRIHKDIDHRINLLELQFRQLAEQNKYLIGVIQKRDHELDALLQNRLLYHTGTPSTNNSEANQSQFHRDVPGDNSRKSSDSQLANIAPQIQPNITPLPLMMFQNQLPQSNPRLPNISFPTDLSQLFEKTSTNTLASTINNSLGNIESLINYYTHRNTHLLGQPGNSVFDLKGEGSQLQNISQGQESSNINASILNKFPFNPSSSNNMCVVGFMPVKDQTIAPISNLGDLMNTENHTNNSEKQLKTET